MHRQFVLDTQRYLNACYTMIEEEQREQRSIRTDPSRSLHPFSGVQLEI